MHALNGFIVQINPNCAFVIWDKGGFRQILREALKYKVKKAPLEA